MAVTAPKTAAVDGNRKKVFPAFRLPPNGGVQGGQMGDFIPQIKILGDILVLRAIKFVSKNAKKAQILGSGRYFPLSLCSKVRFWAI